MIYLLDNYDSFTFNLYQAFRELGADVTVARNDEVTVEHVASLLPDLTGIVLSPGPCTPTEAGIAVPLVQHLAGRVPMLGVCLGSPGDRRGVWRKRDPGAHDHARKNLAHRA